ncbi:uncharacterized protein TNCV_4065901 [Trichonephila clavipes]|uniref:Transposase n=1 Tax=Trichonephila clavipes TaxID=2585209 RepID=A0A8X6W8Z8_TRICX|nr:uncharacterized protein TNCV_4065901 [Trichonephila clavipes]
MGSIIEIKKKRQDFMPLNFPFEDIHLIVQLPVLFNACIKLGIAIDVSPYIVPHLQRISAENVLGYALVHPESSIRDIGKASSHSKSTLWNILRTYGAYPYSPVLSQELMPGDQDRRFDFCNFVLNTLNEKPDFFNEVLWSDECQFSRKGTINTQNRHDWSLENPHLIRPNRHQVRWSVNVLRNMEEYLNWSNIFRWIFNIRILHGNFIWTVSRFFRRWSFLEGFVTNVVPA